MSLADQIVSHPATAPIVAAIVGMILDLARGVGPRRAVTFYSPIRKAAALLFHRPAVRLLGRPLIRDKTNSGEYITTSQLSLIQIAVRLWRAGYQFNPTATVKYVVYGDNTEVGDGEKSWEVLSVGQRTEDGRWHHVYVIKPSTGVGYEIRGHLEAPPDDPDEHTQGDRLPGDHNGWVQEAL